MQIKDITSSNTELLKRPAIGVSYACEIMKDFGGLKETACLKKLSKAMNKSLNEAGYESWEEAENKISNGNFRDDMVARNSVEVLEAAKVLSDMAAVGQENMELIKDCMIQSHAQLIMCSELYKLSCVRCGWSSFKNELKGDNKVRKVICIPSKLP